MKSIVGLIFALAYFFLVIALLVAREFVTGYIAWQSVDAALSLLTIPGAFSFLFLGRRSMHPKRGNKRISQFM